MIFDTLLRESLDFEMMENKNELTAPIVDYDRIRIQCDGDGVRTIVFFYGCPLRCKYCINPQTWTNEEVVNKYTPQELLEEVEIDSLYFQATNGGITFGGGEPLLHTEFIEKFIEIAPKEWNYWVETSLAVPFDNIQKIAPYIAKFVVDIKSLDADVYQNYTGKPVQLAEENLKRLLELVGAKKIWVRVPLIPNYNTRKQQKETVKKLKAMGIKSIQTFDYVTRR